MEHRGIHHLRHTFITTTSSENGVHQHVAQQLAGHADSCMTREVYTHVTDSMLSAAAEAIERAGLGHRQCAPRALRLGVPV